MERWGRDWMGVRQRRDGKAASVDSSFKTPGSEGRPRNGAVAEGCIGSGGHFQRWETLEHICLWSRMIPWGRKGEGTARGGGPWEGLQHSGRGVEVGWEVGRSLILQGPGRREVGRFGNVENS